MIADPDGLEAELLEQFELDSGKHGVTIVAFALG